MFDFMQNYGFLSISGSEKKVLISYAGNMGASIERDVAPAFAALYGDKFDEIRELATKEEGSPDYSYMLTITRKRFNKIVAEEV